MKQDVCIAALAVAYIVAAAGACAAGEPGAGKRVFEKCAGCHNVGENAKNAIGPELNGVVGRKAGSVDGYAYSDEMKESGITWDEANLDDFLKNPQAKVLDSKMAIPGLSNEKDRADVIAYLSTFGPDGKAK